MPPLRNKRALETAVKAVSPPPDAAHVKKKLKSAATKKAVLNFFKPASQKEPEPATWTVADGSLLIGKYCRPGETDEKRGQRPRIAGFDLDGTLIVTQSGNKFAKNETDWKWWDPCVPTKLKQLYYSGYQVVIFTNQAGIKAPKKETANFKKLKLKVASIFETLDLPLTLYAATENDKFRKPRTGMWDKMKADFDLDVHGLDLENSYLVGDAAGREGDFSDSDRHWSMNIGIGFHTPEEFFLNKPGKEMLHRFDPSTHLDNNAVENKDADPLFKPSDAQEIVLFAGSPGCGKSSFFHKFLEPLGYGRINQDTLKTRERCIKAARELLEAGKPIVIDNTNADVATRAIWISLANKHGIPIQCVYFTAPAELCQHNDAVRAFGGDLFNPEHRTVLPNIAFSSYKSRFTKPQKNEGFTNVTEVEFQFRGGEEERRIWGRFWI